MAVSGIAQELSPPREKQESADGSRTYHRQYLVTVTSATDDANVALGATGIPGRYFPYITSSSIDLGAVCTERNAKQSENSPYHWMVEVTYTTLSRDQRDDVEDPLAAPPEIEWSFETIQVPIVGTPDQNVVIAGSTAVYTGAVKSPAGEIYNPPPMLDESRPVVTITRNEATFNVNTAVLYQNSINSDVFFGVPARCAKMRGITGSWQTSKGKSYWRVTYTIAFKRDTWDLQLMNYGSLYKSTSTSTSLTQFMSAATTDAAAFPCMGFLNSDGTSRASTDSPTYTIFRVHKELPFAALNLPLSPNRS